MPFCTGTRSHNGVASEPIGDFGAEVATDHVGVDHDFFDRARGVRCVDRQRPWSRRDGLETDLHDGS